MEEKANVLLQGLQKGNIKSFEVLFHQHYPSLYAFTKGLIKDGGLAEDITQNVFMKLWLNREKLNECLSLKNYLFVIARNEVYNHFRSKNTSSVSLMFRLRDDSARNHLHPEDEYDIKEISEAVSALVEKMPSRRKQVFTMSRKEYLSNKEIAERLGLSKRTVEKHLEIALQQIRHCLDPFFFIIFMLFLA